MKSTIYRVQDGTGRGPYRPGFSKFWVKDRPDLEHLSPWYVEFPEDVWPIATKSIHTGCGCLTLDQLRRWIVEDEYSVLVLFGYSAVEVPDVEIIAESGIQAIFTRDRPLNEGVRKFKLY